MNVIENKDFIGERPLFAQSNIQLIDVEIAKGESAIKEANYVYANSCVFKGKYPFWYNTGSKVENSLFTSLGRAAIWYCNDFKMINTRVDAPKMFREVDGLYEEKVKFTNAQECIWWCKNIELSDVSVINGDYIFKNCANIKIDRLNLQGNYSF